MRLSILSRFLLLLLLFTPTIGAQAPPDDPRPPRRGGAPPDFPVVRALDADGDGVVSAEEMEAAPERLRALDRNGDGVLSGDEMLPRFGPGGGRGDRGSRRGGFGGFGRGGGGPRLSPAELPDEIGEADVPDRTTFERLSYQGEEVMIDTHLTGLEFVKFQIENATTDTPDTYFINTEAIRSHPQFMQRAGIEIGREGQMRGVLVFRPLLKAPDGTPGLYTFEFEPNDAYPFPAIALAYRELVAHAPILEGRLAYHALPRARARTMAEKADYDAAAIPIFVAEDVYADIAYLPLNPTTGVGRLRVLEPGDRPGAREVVICRTLPNEMPRVAGIITCVRQTPLSHVNLRAVQDAVPNAFIRGALEDPAITSLVGKPVVYTVGADGYSIREASVGEVETHFAALRPAQPRTPPRDLSATRILPLSELGFVDARSVGTKAANLATLRRIGLPAEIELPDGFAVPFSFYVRFMEENGLFTRAREILGAPGWREDAEVREAGLAELRAAIEAGEFPADLSEALSAVQAAFPAGTSIRCRSSTNNEDLPGFSGAGLYDSFTHKEREGHLSKSIRQVYASLWNFRAVEEREFARIDHFTTAMGVLLHPNFSREQANGVAVTRDIVYGTEGQIGRASYVNAQLGEALVTNPDGDEMPEERILHPRGPGLDRMIQRSSLAAANETVLSVDHCNLLRRALEVIEREFRALHGASDPFAMEIEFKVTELGDLSIKQARPWVFSPESADEPGAEPPAGTPGRSL